LSGCNFACPFCHNKHLWGPTFIGPTNYDILLDIPINYILEYLQSRHGKITGVVISGGEPTINSDLPELCKSILEVNSELRIKLDTNGSNPHMLKYLIDNHLVNFVAMDIKAPWKKYELLGGVKIVLEDIKESVEIIKTRLPNDHIFRTTYYTELLDDKDINEIKSQLEGEPLTIQRYISEY